MIELHIDELRKVLTLNSVKLPPPHWGEIQIGIIGRRATLRGRYYGFTVGR